MEKASEEKLKEEKIERKTENRREVNPFAAQTPEDIGAEETLFLFVDVFTDFYKILRTGHTFIHGPRGCGKSMMFRYMLPDCQRLVNKKNGRSGMLRELEYFAVYIPIKLTGTHVKALNKLENKNASLILNEHWLTITILEKLFSSFDELAEDGGDEFPTAELCDFYTDVFSALITDAGWKKPLLKVSPNESAKEIFSKMSRTVKQISSVFNRYILELSQAKKPVVYKGIICAYLDFLLPLMKEIKKFAFMPKSPIFLLFDDADNLNEAQKMVLNTWVSYRTSSDVSIKASTQLNYDFWYTMGGITIDTPHDFSEVNIADVYTNQNKGTYRKRIEQIVERRLENAGISVSPKKFFPPNEKQEAAIKEVARRIVENFPVEGRGYSVNDDVTRYARPIYMASLKGTSKSGSSYSYSGFEQLVHLSSGIIRHFLEAAAQMYGEMQAKNPEKSVALIEPATQNKIVRQLADKFMLSEFEKLEPGDSDSKVSSETVRKLKNLVEALGRMFETILVSDASERRVFSIAFSDRPSQEIIDVLKLGVRYGYFHESMIGLKDGTGRTRLYVLSRRLAPHFYLDPTSFAGYKFVTSKAISEAMRYPDTLVGKVKRRGFDSVFQDEKQPSFDFERSEE